MTASTSGISRVQPCLVEKAVIILEQNQIGRSQSGLAQDRQRLNSQPSRHPVKDVIRAGSSFLAAIRSGRRPDSLRSPVAVGGCSAAREASSARAGTGGFSMVVVVGGNSRRLRSCRYARNEETFDATHPRNPNVPPLPAVTNRAPYFAGARASMWPEASHVTAGLHLAMPAASRHHVFQVASSSSVPV